MERTVLFATIDSMTVTVDFHPHNGPPRARFYCSSCDSIAEDLGLDVAVLMMGAHFCSVESTRTPVIVTPAPV